MQFSSTSESSLERYGITLPKFRAKQLGYALVVLVRRNHAMLMEGRGSPFSLHELATVDPSDLRYPQDHVKIAALNSYIELLNSHFVDLNLFKNMHFKFPHLKCAGDKALVEFQRFPQSSRKFLSVIADFITNIRFTDFAGDQDRLENFFKRAVFFKRNATRLIELASVRASVPIFQREYGGNHKFKRRKKPGALLP